MKVGGLFFPIFSPFRGLVASATIYLVFSRIFCILVYRFVVFALAHLFHFYSLVQFVFSTQLLYNNYRGKNLPLYSTLQILVPDSLFLQKIKTFPFYFISNPPVYNQTSQFLYQRPKEGFVRESFDSLIVYIVGKNKHYQVNLSFIAFRTVERNAVLFSFRSKFRNLASVITLSSLLIPFL